MVGWKKIATIGLAVLTAFYGSGAIVSSHVCHTEQTRDVGLWSAGGDCVRHACCRHHSHETAVPSVKKNCCEDHYETFQLDVRSPARKFSLPYVPAFVFCAVGTFMPPVRVGAVVARLAHPFASPPPLIVFHSPSFLQVFRF